MADSLRIKNNTYFAKKNHLPLKKSEVTKQRILASGVTRLEGLGKTIESGLDPSETIQTEILTRDSSTILTRDGSTVVARS